MSILGFYLLTNRKKGESHFPLTHFDGFDWNTQWAKIRKKVRNLHG